MQNMTITANRQLNKNQMLVLFVLFLFFPPFISLPMLVGYVFMNEKKGNYIYYLLFLCLASYFAAINATKTPGSGGDQFRYCIAYLNVPTIGFWKSLIFIYGNEYASDPGRTKISGEFMNGIYNYIGYYITFGKYYLFAFIYTFIEYMLIFWGFFKFCQNLKKPHIPIICGALIISFFYLFFQYTLHIQKQFFAQAIMMYVLGSLSYEGKMTHKLWLISVVALFTHASVIWYFPFLSIPKLRKPLSKVGLILLSLIFCALIFFGPSIAGDVTSGANSSALSYSIGRVANAENDYDGMTLNMLQVIVVGIPMAAITIRQLWMNRKKLKGYSAFILNVVLMLLLSIVAMNRQPIAQYRYFMMIFAFMPFVYPFAFNRIKFRDAFLVVLSVVMIVWYYYQFDKIIYEYASEVEIVSVPPILLTFFCNLGF